MNGLSKACATWEEIDEAAHGQRIDNFLIKILKGVPKSHIYRVLRSGEVRVNSGRVDAAYRLQAGDRVRIPPVRVAPEKKAVTASRPVLERSILFEDDALIVLDKPAGMAAHGGSGVSRGVIEQLRAERPHAKFLELAHRLDRETSGILLLAKKRSALTGLHEILRAGGAEKHYLVLVCGKWRKQKQSVKLALHKFVTPSGERRVRVSDEGQEAHTVFSLVRAWGEFSLLDAELKTGRTHQIRVHLAHLGFPIAGDDKYGDFARNKQLARLGLKRMFLHAARIAFVHPLTAEAVAFEAPLPRDLQDFLATLDG